jgi:hypothetical protein
MEYPSMLRCWTLVACAGLGIGLGACAGPAEVSSFPDLRLPPAAAPAVLSAEDRDAAIADLQKAAASNAAAAK